MLKNLSMHRQIKTKNVRRLEEGGCNATIVNSVQGTEIRVQGMRGGDKTSKRPEDEDEVGRHNTRETDSDRAQRNQTSLHAFLLSSYIYCRACV
jgi:hypothetical protein